MDSLTHNVRRANWLNIIDQCQERPANVTVRQWLKDNDINEKSYYYWLRKFRKETYDQMQIPAVTENTTEISFVELAAPASEKVSKITRVVLACGTVDLRKGIDSLSMIIGDKYKQNPFEKGTLFLFCGRRSDRIKGLLWMGDGFLPLYKRLEAGSLSWPRTTEEAADLTEEQFNYLMLGLNPLDLKIKDVTPQKPF